jgi:hypothetical protein
MLRFNDDVKTVSRAILIRYSWLKQMVYDDDDDDGFTRRLDGKRE